MIGLGLFFGLGRDQDEGCCSSYGAQLDRWYGHDNLPRPASRLHQFQPQDWLYQRAFG